MQPVPAAVIAWRKIGILHVATGKDAGNVRSGRIGLGPDVAQVVEIDLSLEDLGVGIVPDRNEKTVHVELGFLLRLEIHELQARDAGVRASPQLPRRPYSRWNLIFGLFIARSCMIFEARRVSRRWITFTSVANFVRKVDSSIAESPPPTTAIFLPRKKNPSQVAQVETPCPISCPFGLDADQLGGGSGRNNHGLRLDFLIAVPDLERALAEVHLVDKAVHDFGSEMLRLLPHVVHEIRSQDAFGKPREVLDQRGQGELAARFLALDQKRRKVRAGAIDRGGQTRRVPIQ